MNFELIFNDLHSFFDKKAQVSRGDRRAEPVRDDGLRGAQGDAKRLRSERRETRRGLWRGPLKAAGSRSREGRQTRSRRRSVPAPGAPEGDKARIGALAAWKPKAPGARNKTKGAGAAPKARAGRRKFKALLSGRNIFTSPESD